MITGSTSLGSLVVYLQANSTQFDRTFREAEEMVNMSGGHMIKATAAVAAAMGAASVGFAAASIRAFAEFDDAMTKSIAIMGKVSASTRKEMEKTAIELSTRTATSATKAAESFYFLASAGMNAQQAMGALPVVEQFAAAGAFDMAKATEYLADAHSAMGLRVNDATENIKNLVRVSDVLVEAANRSNASVQQFAEALTTKAAAALRNLNKTVEEGVAVLSVYADQGIKGALAGEKLAIVLRDTQTAARENAEAWRVMGVSAFDAQGSMLPIVEIVEGLETALEGMSDEAKAATFAMLGFNDRSVDAFKSLLGTSQKIREYQTALENAGGVTAKVAQVQLTSFSKQMQVMQNQINAAMIEIGEGMIPHLRSLNTMMQESRKEAGGFSEQIKALKEAFATLTEFGIKVVLQGVELFRVALGAVRVTLMAVMVLINESILLMASMMKLMAAFIDLPSKLIKGRTPLSDALQGNIDKLKGFNDTLKTSTKDLAKEWDKLWKGMLDNPAWNAFDKKLREQSGKTAAEAEAVVKAAKDAAEKNAIQSLSMTLGLGKPVDLRTVNTATDYFSQVPNLMASTRKQQIDVPMALPGQSAAAMEMKNYTAAQIEMIQNAGSMKEALLTPFEKASREIEKYGFLLEKRIITQTQFNRAVELFGFGIEDLPQKIKSMTTDELQLLATAKELKDALKSPYQQALETMEKYGVLKREGLISESEHAEAVKQTSLGIDNLADKVGRLTTEQLDLLASSDQLVDGLKDPFEKAVEELEKYRLLLKEGASGMTPELFERAKQQALSQSQFFAMPTSTGLPGAGGGAPGVPGPGAMPQQFDQFSGFMGLDQNQNDLQRLQNQEEMLRQSYERQKQIVIEATTLTEEERLRVLKQGEENFARMSQQYNTARNHLLLTSAEGMFSDLADIARNAAGEQSGIYKVMFAASKAFAIADSMVKIQQAIANAAATPWPMNIAAIAQVVSLTAGLIGNIQSVMMTFEGGGYTPSGPRTGGVDGRGGFLAVMHPDEKVTDLTRERERETGEEQTGGGVNIYITQTFTGGVTENDLARAKEDMKRETATAVLDGISRGGQFRKGIRR